MPQPINLYARSLCQGQQSAGLVKLLVQQGALAGAALLVGAGLQWHTHQLRETTRHLAVQSEGLRSGLQQSPASRLEQTQRDQLQRLRDHEAAVQRLQGLLDNGSAGRRDGYADTLEALARQADPAVWITGLKLQGSDDAIEIKGRMTDPSVLADYLRRLESEPRFKGRPFATLEIRRGDLTDSAIEGAVATAATRASYSEFTLSSPAPRNTDPSKP